MGDRAVSTVVSYVLTLGIVVILLTSLVGVFAPLVTNQQDDAVRSNLEVFGNDLAGDLESADRLAAAAGENGTVVLRTRLPDRVGGSPYEIELESAGAKDRIILRSSEYETQMTVTVATMREVETQSDTLDGGTLVITAESGTNKLVIEDA